MSNIIFTTSISGSIVFTAIIRVLIFFRFLTLKETSTIAQVANGFTLNPIIKWILIWSILLIVLLLFSVVCTIISFIHPNVSSIIATVILVLCFQYLLDESTSVRTIFDSISWPLFATLAIILRFTSGTIHFYKNNLKSVR